MKVQFYGNDCFSIENKDQAVVFNPNDSFREKSVDIAFISSEDIDIDNVKNAKKTIHLPGEFEISGILVRGFYADDKKTVIYKIVFEGISFIYFGGIEDAPSKELFKKLGENMDMIFVTLAESFNGKKVKDLIELIDPRMAFLGGDSQFFPKMIELGAKIEQENHISVNKALTNEEKIDMIVLGS